MRIERKSKCTTLNEMDIKIKIKLQRALYFEILYG
jgi:hypothetical protein